MTTLVSGLFVGLVGIAAPFVVVTRDESLLLDYWTLTPRDPVEPKVPDSAGALGPGTSIDRGFERDAV